MATIQGVYVALFGRPADPTGLAYFNGVTNNGANLSAINNLAGEKEYTDRFAGMNNVQIVNSIYQSLFNRDAEPTGLNFFVDALIKGTLNINNIAIAILDGAQGSDKTIADNKVAAANLFTAALDTPTEIGSYTGNAAAASARGWLAGVTTTAATQAQADAAVKAVETVGAAGATINLSPSATSLTLSPTAGVADGATTKFTTNLNDTINATTAAVVTTNVAGNDSFIFGATGTKIDGGLGVDTINLAIDTAGLTLAADQLKNIEIINVTSKLGGSGANLAEAKQATQVWSVADTTAAQATAITGLALSVTAGVKGAFGGAANSFAFADSTNTSTAKLALDAATGTTITINAVGTLDVSNVGTSNVTLVGGDVKTINLSGAGSLTFAAPATAEAVAAGSYTGNLTANLSANNALKSYVGGTAIDTITLDTVHTNNITIATGAGADTITVTGLRTVESVANVVTVSTAAGSDKTISLTGGDGADTFVLGTAGSDYAVGATLATQAATLTGTGSLGNVAAVGTTAALANSLVTIADFNKAQDAIKVGDGVTTGGGRQTLLDPDLATISGQSDLLAAAVKAAEFTAVGKASVFNFGTDAYVFVNSGTAAFEVGDTLIKVVGAAAADFTATNFAVI